VNPRKTLPGLKKQRAINRDDFNEVIEKTAQSWKRPAEMDVEPIKIATSKAKPEH
jgi:hypothetical protein